MSGAAQRADERHTSPVGWWFWALLFGLLLALKLCQANILWAEEGYGSAAAVQILHGKALYRDFWFDKPPLAALIYVLWQGRAEFGLRIAEALYGLACSAVAFRFARHLWGYREAVLSAILMAFFLGFDIPSQVTTLGPDLLLVLPAIMAVDCAARRRGFQAGIWCSIGMAANAKGLLIVAVCAAWYWTETGWLLAGFAAGCVPWFIWLALTRAWHDYWLQVWWFGSVYSRNSFVRHPFEEMLVRTLHWAGFHAALVLGLALALWRRAVDRRVGWVAWFAVAAIGIWAGERFFERYYFVLLPPMVLIAGRGFSVADKRWRVAGLLALCLPLARFGPRYVLLARDVMTGHPTTWTDVQLNADSAEVGRFINARSMRDDTLLVWGYRPDLFAYTQLAVAGRFLDSQLLTGVLADRHLTSAAATLPDLARENRRRLIELRPTWIVDGLALMNPALAMTAYGGVREWLETHYDRLTQTRDSIVYRLKSR